MALAAGNGRPGSCKLAELEEASLPPTQPATTSPRVVGYVVHVAGGVFQRRRRLGSLLSGYARPGGRRAGGGRDGGTVARLPQPGPARVAYAPDACGCSQLAVIHPGTLLPGLEPLVAARDRYPGPGCSRKPPS